MGEIVSINRTEIKDNNAEKTDIAAMTEEFLLEARTSTLPMERTISMPIAEIATLGTGLAAIAPALQTAVQNADNATQLYRLANAGAGDALKVAKDGKLWGALKTADGGSKFAKFEAVNPETVAEGANVGMLLMAVALYSIERELGKIEEMEKEIISFLQIEKESEIEADVVTLNKIISKYKSNWDNEHYVTSHHKMVCDIQRTARKNIISFQKNTSEIIGKKQLIVGQNKVNQTLRDLQKKFQYYRLSLYIFSLASMTEIMLSGNYKEENISNSLEEIRKYSDEYRELFSDCSVFLEKMTSGSVETNALKGIGFASDKIGKAIGRIPKIKDGQIDEFLQGSGEKLKNNAEEINKDVVSSFSKVSDPNTRVFMEKMEDMIKIYDKTEEICFDKNNIYLISG